MSITDELREIARKNLLGPIDYGKEGFTKIGYKKLLAIADRIDAEHKRVVRERRRSCVYYDPERHYCSYHDFDVSGYVELPKDADGEYIHIGDVMEWIDLEGKVSVTCTAEAVGVDAFIAWDKANGRYAQKCATAYRHYHAPTVEDVLREFFSRYVTTKPKDEDDAIIAEYAAKLRLAKEVKR